MAAPALPGGGAGSPLLPAATANAVLAGGGGRPSVIGTKQAHLRIEYMSHTEARVLSWFSYITTLLLLASVVVLMCLKFNTNERDMLFRHDDWYIGNTAVAAAALLLLLLLGAWFAANLWSTRAARRSWSNRRLALCRAAGVLLLLEIMATAFWLAPYAVTVGVKCAWFGVAVAWLALFRWTAYNSCFLWCCVTMHACCRYRGPCPPADPDEQLVMDITPGQKLRVHAPKLLVWAAFEGLVISFLVLRVDKGSDVQTDQIDCRERVYVCDREPWAVALTVLQIALVCLYAITFCFYLWRAFKDHAQLPFARYRLSNLFIRLLARHVTVTFLSTLFSVVVLTTVQFQSCWSYLDSILGVAPVQLALVLLAVVVGVALMPQLEEDQDKLGTWQQQFAWTLADLPATRSARDAQMLAASAGTQGGLQHLLARLSGGRRWLDGVLDGLVDSSDAPQQQGAEAPEASSVAEQQMKKKKKEQQQQQQQQAGKPPEDVVPAAAAAAAGAADAPHLQQPGGSPHSFQQRVSCVFSARPARKPSEPMFCLELAVRLYAWAKYAYRHWPDSPGGMNQADVQALFGLTGFAAPQVQQTDTRAVLGWRGSEAVVCAFRGTQTMANVVSDIKAWTTPVLPKRWHAGQLVRVHAGFSQAYNAGGLRQELLQHIEGAGFGPDSAFKLYLTGHSLGGALAMLAAYDLQQRFPLAELAVVVFGAPRVGNRAFARHFRSLVPDAWGVVNEQDPVPRIPGGGFLHATLLVRTGWQGDLIVRPSYFERSVISRSGGNLAHHLLGRYALALAAVVKAQFSSSKWLPGGEAGASALAEALDLQGALMCRHLDWASLRDPRRQPQLAEQAAPKATKPARQQPPAATCWGRLLAWCRRPGRTAAEGSGGTGGGEDEEAVVEDEGAASLAAQHSQQVVEDEEQQPMGQQGAPGGAQGAAQEAAAFAHDAAAFAAGGAAEAVHTVGGGVMDAAAGFEGLAAWWPWRQREPAAAAAGGRVRSAAVGGAALQAALEEGRGGGSAGERR